LKKPVNSCTSVADTRMPTLPRSSAFLADLIGGHRNRFGYTDHSFTKMSGIVAVPVATCRPWVMR